MAEFLIRCMATKSAHRLPGFGLSLGYTVFYLSLIVLIPLAGLIFKSATLDLPEWGRILTSKRTLMAYRLSFGIAFAAALVNAVFGTLIAWVFSRYRFWGKSVLDALLDLPFALPTAVTGIVLTTMYAPTGFLGMFLMEHGVEVAYTPLGMILALAFIGLPFVVRTVQPVLEDLDREMEEAAASLGANRWQTLRRVVFPVLFPPILTGFVLAFARGIGEYGSIVFISGNIPFKTEVASLLIMAKLEQYDYAGATALGLVMLVVSFTLLFLLNGVQWWVAKRTGMAEGRG